ncbi:hypothetical protein BLNAU_22586 [Blattamonas nauphoetae]|uniref:Uncharacterized protein n=1 Tax=Blattamonas nauphoetae TaxID=2049346 RepID=A0ABQ9WVP9_9EUKA|nr:hypothetical protein BLNAU_22586 [Blattamonas nauphoetae]
MDSWNTSHFILRNNVFTRTEKGTDEIGRTKPSTVLFSEPITKGIVSVTFVVLTLAESGEKKGFINFGLIESSAAVPRLGRVLGKNIKHSVSLTTSSEESNYLTQIKLDEECNGHLSKKARVVMEVNMDSTPRTVQFFVNGKVQKCYVSGIPETVRIGFSADVMGTSLQITSIIHCTRPTCLADKMKELKWTDTEELYNERTTKQYKPIRREAEGSMPALLTRNPEHFKIEGNVITRTATDCHGPDFPFGTVMLDGVVENSLKSVAITILALPQTESSRGVVMFGGIPVEKKHIPKSPKGLGITKHFTFGLCSFDGVLYESIWAHRDKSGFSPLQVGDQVVLEVDYRSFESEIKFTVNGKIGQNEISRSRLHLSLGVCSF